ncbi:phage major capsid protein [Pseudogemmobacter sp. CC-YST710]|uniref:Phage major capsid protein n=1 Tax=Pseudogemmobacter faecipullorum TaxID=2755041 RepID=A0ABS8CNS3_9RHOB|nr:phage major capsid protein [Pseudogemmobacter faecipullorum]MCB5411027.1 phage major capsid protein [Pseudogemmobacter faecipullorum]
MLRLDFKAALSVTDEGAIEGLASVFGTADRGGDVVHKGAFAQVKFPIAMLDNHDQTKVIGVWSEGIETPEGLRVKGQFTMSDPAALIVRDKVKMGAMGGLSIGYRALNAPRRKGGGRDLRAVDLAEISVVGVPMHPGARITLAKSAEQQKGDHMDPEELEKALQGVETKAIGAIAPALAEALKPLTARLDGIEAKSNRPGGEGGGTEVTLERKAFQSYLKFGDRAPELDLKALTMVSDGQGGYLAPPEFSAEIIRDLVEFSPLHSLASVRGTSAPSVVYPTRKPFGNAVWDDEIDETTESPTKDIFGMTELTLRGMSTFVDISNVLMQDAPEVETEVRAALAEDYAKKGSVAFVNGNGVTQPEGVMVNSKIAKTKNGHATNLSADALINLLYAMPANYRNAGAWAMNGTTLGAIRKLKDGDGRFLWQPSYQAGQPEMILGRPVVEVLDMPDIAAGAFPILYGDFSGYVMWAEDSHIIPTPGNTVDLRAVDAFIRELCARFHVQEIAYDKTFAGVIMADQVEAGLPAVEMRQG